MSDLLIESLTLQRIKLIARIGAMDVCNGDDKTLALVWINEMNDQLLQQLLERLENNEKQVALKMH